MHSASHSFRRFDCPLYDPQWEHDACGTGFLAQVSGVPSHALVQDALDALARLTHRGAQDADAGTSDGSGILTQLPRLLLQEEFAHSSHSSPATPLSPASPDDLAVGMFFLPSQERTPVLYEKSIHIVEQTITKAGFAQFSWRNPPLDDGVLGTYARKTAPTIRQLLLLRPLHVSYSQYESELYYLRRLIEKRLCEAEVTDCHVVSLSHKTIIYKGLLAPTELARFYLDLADPRYMSALAVFHQRYSTNTLPAWPLAQPMRIIAHNGEINTIQGNRNWMAASEGSLSSPLWGERIPTLLPVIQEGSDSAQFDNALELLTRSGRGLLHAVHMMLPAAWEHDDELDAQQRAWYAYHAGLLEPWDGPAALAFSDGSIVGAALDRNGLRPARYTLTRQGTLVVASEAGVLPIEAQDVVEKGRLGPGEMIAVDVERHVVLHDAEMKAVLAQQQPYQQWVEQYRLSPLTSDVSDELMALSSDALFRRQQLYGYTHEDVEMVLRPILTENKEPMWSMGDDTPLAVLSTRTRSFADHFHQRFAQVTNPPIDPLRERIVMSLESSLGSRESLLTETPRHAQVLPLPTPLLTERQLDELRAHPHFRSVTLNVTFPLDEGENALEAALDRLEQEAVQAVQQGATLLILSDQQATLAHAPIPMLIAVGAMHHGLIRRGLRTATALVCETSAAWDIHQIALLLGYGAEAVVPSLALESIRALAGERKLEHLTRADAVKQYIHVVEDGLRKVMARMGISTIRNIIGAGLFEVVGLEEAFAARCFAGSALQTGHISYASVARDIIAQFQALRATQEQESQEGNARQTGRRKLTDLGRYRFRRDAEFHTFNPFIVRALQKAAQSGNKEDYRQFTDLVHNRPATALRDLFSFRASTPIPLEQVEPMERIRARFVISAMSVGALSSETHRTIAAAMNSIGGRNNTGEGGEDPTWYQETLEGSPVSSKIKQIASARFGVTTEYLVRAEEIEIKMAQGSKPGEGGQLPPAKVTPFIARLRHTAPGVSLISPPPHHDIYSIEDIAQLIYDLHQVNPKAKVGVKLVSSIGVGTIAAGVAKAYADYVLISGHDGGTGASPLQSIKHAGMPWERGLAEAQQVLVRNGLRKRVRVRVDGGLKTGRDVVIGAMLGAEEFGFGTAALVSLGCDMARQCHLNTCPAGIATQREDLRAKFTGKPQFLINYLTLVAEEVREWMAQLGVARLEDLIGRADLLQCAPEAGIDLEDLLSPHPEYASPSAHVALPSSPIAEQLLTEAEEALNGDRSVILQHSLTNGDRSVGASLAGEIARRYGNVGLPGVSVTCTFYGAAGQSFGAFCVQGMRLFLHGEANDYVGKGMTGGQIVIAPPIGVPFQTQENVLIGNTVLYGATGGQLFAAGRAGERFAVRNSGALAIVEGVGDHACEYMTGGMVVVLGETGRNFGAGMSSGVAYVLDREHVFSRRYNPDLVELERINDSREYEALYDMIQTHARKTHSQYATRLLENWEYLRDLFWRVQPRGTETTALDFAEYENAIRA